MLVQSISVFSLGVFLWALLPEIKWMMMMIFLGFLFIFMYLKDIKGY